MLSYAFKRVIRSWKLFAALLLGVVLASIFFAGVNVGADTAAKQVLTQQLNQVPVDIVVYSRDDFWSSTNATKIAEVAKVQYVTETEIISRATSWEVNSSSDNAYFTLVGILDNSRVYDGLNITSGSSSLQANETYVWVDSEDAGNLNLGDYLKINLSVSVWLGESPNVTRFTLDLKVAGFIQLDDKALSIATGDYYYYGISPARVVVRTSSEYRGNLLVLDWNKTFAPLLDSFYALSVPYSPIDTEVLVYLDRESVISPWDVSGSLENIQEITSQVGNKVAVYGADAYSYLESVLIDYQMRETQIRLGFIVTALPVFFVAWYMGMTISDVSLNLRRREIGLLLTKGFSRTQLLGMFLGEAILIGVIGGLIGVALSFVLTPFFAAVGGGTFSGATFVAPGTVILTVVFSVILTFLSVFLPARRASKLNVVDALREYRYVEDVKPYRQRWPWIAFLLGSFKIVILLLGVNLAAEMIRLRPANIFIAILMGIVVFLDLYVLNYIGPLLFFWGFTKLFIRGSLKFQALVTKAAKFFGDLGAIATRNVQRNPARSASIAFLIALIIGYSFQVVGTLASNEDFAVREIYFNVGADVSVSLTYTANVSMVVDEINKNLTDCAASITVEYSFSGSSSGWGSLSLRAVDPEAWLDTAYYEREWFTVDDLETAFQSLASDNNTIILDRSLSQDLNVGDYIAVTFGDSVYELRIVGFFGKEQSDTFFIGPMEAQYIWSQYWSYIPQGLYSKVSAEVWASAKILINLEAGVDGEAVADQIRALDLEGVSEVNSVTEQLNEWQSNILIQAPLNVQRLGVTFAVLAVTIGTALVTFVSLRERSREASLMSVRGLSFKQLVGMLLTENLAVVVFSVLLGAVVGLIWVHGNVAAANSATYYLLSRRVVFPMGSVLTLGACLILVFASTILPVLIMSRRYVSRIERMVR